MTSTPAINRSYENRVVLILAIVGGIAALDMLTFNFLSAFIAADLHLTSGQVGMVGGSGLITWSIGAIAAALLSDKLGRRRIFLVVGLVAFGLMSTGTAFATSFGTLLIARLLVGLGEGPVVPIESAIMLAESSPHRRGLNMGIVQTFGAQLVGGIIGPLLLVALATRLGWRDAFVIASVPAFIMAAVVQFGIREPPPIPATGPRLSAWQSILAVAADRNIRLCFLIGTMAVAWLATMSIFIPLWMIRQLHFSPFAMSVVMACLGVGGAIGSVLIPSLSDRFGRRPVMVGFALSGLLLPIGLLFGPTTLIPVCGVVLLGRLFAGIFPLFIAIIPMESVDARRGATALSIVMGCAQISGGLLGPVLAGVLTDRLSSAAPFWMTIAFALCAAILGLFLYETAPRITGRRGLG